MSYRNMAGSLKDKHFVGVLVFIELHRRLLGGRFGSIPKVLSDDAFAMGGYCLDAPEVLPGGACRYFEIGPGQDDWIVEQVMVSREQ